MRSRTARHILGLSFAFLSLAAGTATAQNASSAGAFELYPTLNAVGARLTYAGDVNGNAVAHLEWRRAGTGAWTRGVDMTRITNQRWAGSLFWLLAGTAYDVRGVIEDPDGGSSATATVVTRAEPNRTPSGITWWVATDGLDTNPGTATQPFATLQAAANRANPGDQIRVRAGVYYQSLDVNRAGTAAALIHVVADAPGAILDGSDPAFLHRSDWRSDGGGIYSVPFTAVTRLVCVDSLQRLYHQASLVALQTDANGVAQGWTVEGGRLWLKLEDGSSPALHTVHVARLNVGVVLDRNYWRVSGFEIRYYGTTVATEPTASGVILIGAVGCVVSDNHVHTIGGRPIHLRALAADNLIERNLCRDPRIGGVFPRAACKSHDEENAAISQRGGRGNVIRVNTCTGTFDGIDTSGGDLDENVASDCDIHDNTISLIADDALEPEVTAGINLRLWKNHVDNVYSGLSIAPNYVGPEYVLYNTFTNYWREAFKFSISSIGQTWLCHNTATTSVAGKPALWPTGPYSNKHFRNNILYGNGSASVSDDTGESETGCDFDGDLVYASYPAVFRWKGVNYSTLALLRSGTGFEMNGRQGDPLFASPLTGDYGLKPGSPAIDAGLRLYGINDGYMGAAPDIGAIESGAVLDAAPPVVAALRLDPPAPNPARGEVRFGFSLAVDGAATLEIFDLSGRRLRRVAGGALGAGEHVATWDGRDESGRGAAPGLYFARLTTATASLTRRIARIP